MIEVILSNQNIDELNAVCQLDI